jgi:ankyrin repeat protein
LGTAVMVTPWAIATARGFTKIVDLLGENGALSDVFSAAYIGDVDTLVAAWEVQPSLLHAEDPAEDFKRITPMHHAIAGGHADVAAWLTARGARIEPHSGWLLTHAAVQNRDDLVELLLDNGADVHRAGILGPLDGDDRSVADLLVARGFDVNADSDYGAMLVRACRGDVSNHEASRVEALLAYGADVNQDHYGLTALHYATRAGRTELMQLLLDHGANVHCRDNDGLTPLAHLTRTRAKFDLIPVMQLLLDHSADVNSRNQKGETVLFSFARRGDRRVVEWLLDHGANPSLRNHAGMTVVDIVQRKKDESMSAVRAILSKAKSPDRD